MYIGSSPNFGALDSQTITTANGSTATFTLNQYVPDSDSIIVTVGNVVQEPTEAYTASGNSITFTENVPNGDTIVIRYLGRSVDVYTGYKRVQRFKYVATNGQQTFTGADANSRTLEYTAQDIDVFYNGVRLDESEFTATNGSSVILGTGATTNAELVILAYKVVQLADVVPASSGGTFTGNVVFSGNATVNGNLTASGTTTLVDTTNTVVKDNLLGLNHGATSNSNDAGIIVERGSTGNDALLIWDESEDKWALGTTTSNASSTGNLNMTTGTLVANLEGTIQTASQTNITAVGTLTGLTTSGAVNVTTGSSGASANVFSDELVVESSNRGGISILTPDANPSNIFFGSPSDNIGGFITYKQSTATMEIGTSISSGVFKINTGDGSLNTTFNSDGRVGIGAVGESTVKLEVNAGALDTAISVRSDGGNGNNRRFNLIGFASGNNTYGGGFKIQTRDNVNVFNDALTIDHAGRVSIGGTLTTTRFFVQESGATTQACVFKGTGSSYATEIVNVMSERTGNSAFSLYKAHSGNNADVEFNFRGDGNGFCDGSFSGGGADYAEYFEWKDGNTADENRLGYSVVLDGHQIRKATRDDTASNIIGVVSANPTIVGDNDVERWKEKYLRTDFGDYDLDENGDRKLNPKWDKSKTYIPREDRKEWDTVGLMGKLRMLKGQPTGERWIKMRDISDTVEEWLVK